MNEQNYMSYALMFADDGTLVDCETFTDLDQARDVAFDFAYDTQRDVAICEEFGVSQNIIEIVVA
jgi:hypothetical protein